MSEVRSIRDLAQRADLEFQIEPDRRRRRTWLAGVGLSIACLGLVALAYFRGDNQIYSAGPLSEAHAFIANDCRQCHTTWSPVKRILAGNLDTNSVHHSSIDNGACLKCHSASEHHPNQHPAHENLSCAACHREHHGKHVLAEVTDQHCLQCHRDLKTNSEIPTRFATHVTGFAESQGHPEFFLWRRLTNPSSVPSESDLLSDQEQQQRAGSLWETSQTAVRLRDVLKKLRPDEIPLKDSKSGLRDRTELKFNHAVHLNPAGVPDRDGRKENLSQNCRACHVVDSAGQYMQPVHFESHCARCHPLWYDNDHRVNEEVPHERFEVIRGFLTEKFTLAALTQNKGLTQVEPARSLPGTLQRRPLSVEQAKNLQDRVLLAEKFVQDHMRQKVQGGCKFCHTIAQTDPTGLPSIVPPDQPERWFRHSRFDHTAHRMLDCQQCHQDVALSRPERDSVQSMSSGDVLLPRIADCRSCHVSPTDGTFIWTRGPKQDRDVQDRDRPTAVSTERPPDWVVNSRCTMCHQYHRRDDKSSVRAENQAENSTAKSTSQPLKSDEHQ